MVECCYASFLLSIINSEFANKPFMLSVVMLSVVATL
jgi:hypothetical protein